MTALVRPLAALALLFVTVSACGRSTTQSTPAQTRSPANTVPALPDLSTLAPGVQQQVRDDYAALLDVETGSSRSAAERGEVYGSVGRRLLAIDLPDAAQPFLQRAQSLMPSDMRWPYFLGHSFRRAQDFERAAAAFERSLELTPDNLPSMVWLGDSQLALGKSADAERVLAKATARDPASVAAWFHRGRAAEAQGQHQTAIDYLTRALTLDPNADAIHYQLGLAFRGLGKIKEAELHLRRRANAESIVPVDPLMDSLPVLGESAASYVVRGVDALDRREWQTAIANFRTASTLAPADGTIQLNLGTSLYLAGDREGARQAFAAAVRLAPRLPKAQYTFGLLEEEEGHDASAVERFTAAVVADPNYTEAHASLADALRRTGRVEEALPHYAKVLAIDPAASQVRFGYAMGLVRLGRWAEARGWLAESVTMYRDQPGFPHALARVLAAAPDDSVRDGREALRITQKLLPQQRTAALLETTAMAQAELGRYDEAIATERQAMTMARNTGQAALISSMQKNLTRYQQRQPCRVPWPPDDPVFFPRPQADVAPRR